MNLKEYFAKLEQVLLENKLEYLKNNYLDKILERLKNDPSARRSERPLGLSLVYDSAKVKAIKDPLYTNETDQEKRQEKLKALTFLYMIEQIMNKKYWQWAVDRYTKRQFMLEDLILVKNNLDFFDTNKKEFKYQDINKYSFHDLGQEISILKNKPESEDELKKKEQELIKNKELEILYDKNGIRISIPHTYEASCFIGKNTSWCTADRSSSEYFHNYSKDGNLYVIEIGNKKYQYHAESQQLMNSKDYPTTFDELFERFPKLETALEEIKLFDNIPLYKRYTVMPQKIENDITQELESRFKKDKYGDYIIESYKDLSEVVKRFRNRDDYVYVKSLVEVKKGNPKILYQLFDKNNTGITPNTQTEKISKYFSKLRIPTYQRFVKVLREKYDFPEEYNVSGLHIVEKDNKKVKKAVDIIKQVFAKRFAEQFTKLSVFSVNYNLRRSFDIAHSIRSINDNQNDIDKPYVLVFDAGNIEDIIAERHIKNINELLKMITEPEINKSVGPIFTKEMSVQNHEGMGISYEKNSKLAEKVFENITDDIIDALIKGRA